MTKSLAEMAIDEIVSHGGLVERRDITLRLAAEIANMPLDELAIESHTTRTHESIHYDVAVTTGSHRVVFWEREVLLLLGGAGSHPFRIASQQQEAVSGAVAIWLQEARTM